jgi:hypothetical protein
MSKQDNLTDFLTDIADAIREKKGSSEKINPQNFSDEIRSIESGSTEVEEKDVNFYDYDGTLLFSYTIAEAQALTELPTPKGHSGLIFDGWNWDYEDVIALDYPMDIGAMYRTDDGKTRLYLMVEEDEGVNVNLRFTQNKANGVVVDFGDGTSPNTYEELSPVIPHHYDKGEYVLTLQAPVNVNIACDGINYYNILGNIAAKSSNILVKVEQGDRTSFGSYAFKSCAKLETLAVHYYKELGWSDTFNGCLSLRCVVYPKGNKYIYSSTSYNDCKSLKVVCITPTITDVNSSFVRCSMKKLRFPDTTVFKGFSGFDGITRFRIPRATTTLTFNTFRECRSLKCIENIDTVGDRQAGSGYLIADCHSMEKIVCSEHWTFIGPHDFYNCYYLKDITLPTHIESIGVYAFYNCGCNTVDFSKSDVIPALASTNAFTKSNPEFRIVVPDALYDEWIVATNWSTYADRIVKASEYQPNNE